MKEYAIVSPMTVVLAILSVGLLGLIIYFAVSPKSSRLLKLTALIALVFIGLSLGVCGIFLIMGPEENPEHIPLPVLQELQPPPAKSGNMLEIIVFFVIFLIVLGVIIVLSVRGQWKEAETGKRVKKSPGLPAGVNLHEELENIGKPVNNDKKEDDSFDLDF